MAQLADYATIIKKPMDLLIVKQRLDDGTYDDISQVTDDINLVVHNALRYNAPQDRVFGAAQQLGQLWDEKLKHMPPKHEVRESSEDPLAASMYGEDSDDDEGEFLTARMLFDIADCSFSEETKIAEYTTQIADLQNKIDSLRAKQANRKANKAKRPKKAAASSKPRKQSAANGAANGSSAKKGRKPKDVSYKDEEDEEEIVLTTTQKTDLANKIGNADADILAEAVRIIKTAQDVEEVRPLLHLQPFAICVVVWS